jgi:hypothetical protein
LIKLASVVGLALIAIALWGCGGPAAIEPAAATATAAASVTASNAERNEAMPRQGA